MVPLPFPKGGYKFSSLRRAFSVSLYFLQLHHNSGGERILFESEQKSIRFCALPSILPRRHVVPLQKHAVKGRLALKSRIQINVGDGVVRCEQPLARLIETDIIQILIEIFTERARVYT